MTIKRGWNPPNAAFAIAKFGLLFRRILVQSIRRVRDDRVNGVVFPPPDPVEAIRMVENSSSHLDRLSPSRHGRRRRLYLPRCPLRNGTGVTYLTVESSWCASSLLFVHDPYDSSANLRCRAKLSRLSWEFDLRPGDSESTLRDGLLRVNGLA